MLDSDPATVESIDRTGFVEVMVPGVLGPTETLSDTARWIRAQHFDVVFYPEVGCCHSPLPKLCIPCLAA